MNSYEISICQMTMDLFHVYFYFHLPRTRRIPDLTMGCMGVSYMKHELLSAYTSQVPWLDPGIWRGVGEIRVAHRSIFLSCVFFVFIALVLCLMTMQPMSLDCPLLIAHSIFSNVCLLYI